MKILFTGSSSFSGMWFIQELARRGHHVTAIFKRPRNAYEGTRRERVEIASSASQAIFDCSFGSDAFLNVIKKHGPFDAFCHHAADVTDYKSPDFDAAAAVTNNTFNLKAVLTSLKEQGCQKVILTGSVFEQNEGAGSDALRAFSPYGLSKGLTSDIFLYYCTIMGLSLGKFVIPNPFGPYEEKRFTTFLVENWMKKATPAVDSPAYVRDNIHVSLLAKAYAHFVESLDDHGFHRCNPSGYPESQGAFTLRFARELSPRLSLPCEVDIRQQKSFPEPKVRINLDVLNAEKLGWNESQAWDELASYYKRVYGT